MGGRGGGVPGGLALWIRRDTCQQDSKCVAALHRLHNQQLLLHSRRCCRHVPTPARPPKPHPCLLPTPPFHALLSSLLPPCRFRAATNMTDRITALTCLAESSSSAAKDAALQEFYESNKDQPLNLLKWLRVQAASSAPGNVARVKALVGHPAFNISNPNNCYSLFLAFARSVNFHALDGSGYEFMGDSVLQVGAWGGDGRVGLTGLWMVLQAHYHQQPGSHLAAQLTGPTAMELLSSLWLVLVYILCCTACCPWLQLLPPPPHPCLCMAPLLR